MKKAVRGGAELESVEARLTDIEKKLDRLRSLYDSFFLGNERTPPNVLRRDVNRVVLELQQQPIGNATMRFRFQSVLQRWVMLTTYWNRTMREIEAGTYQRDLARAHRHMANRGGVLTELEARELGIPATRVKAFIARQQRMATRGALPAVKEDTAATPSDVVPATAAHDEFASEATQVTPPSPAATAAGVLPAAGAPSSARPGAPLAVSPPAARPSRPPPVPAAALGAESRASQPTPPARSSAPPIPGLRAGDLEAFYTRYVEAHRQATGAPPKASLEQLGDKLRQELPKLLNPTVSRISLDVAIEDGKVRMKARPTRE